MVEKFISYLKSHVGDAYVWGAQGECITTMKDYAAWVKKRETSTKNYSRAMTYIKKATKKPLYAFDCSGLGVYFLLENGLIKSDTTAAGLYRKCDKVSLTTLKAGDFVFYHNGIKISHIGFYIGSGYVIEAKGRDDGVVMRKISAGSWNRYGRFTALSSASSTAVDSGAYTFTRVLQYGCKGEDVKELKKALAAKGYGGLTVTNGNFYNSTRTIVKQFQKDKGLTVDGKAGKNTITALGGVWRG